MPRGSVESLAGRLHDEWSSRYGTDANWESSFARSIILSPWCEASSKFGVLYSVVLQLGGMLQIHRANERAFFPEESGDPDHV